MRSWYAIDEIDEEIITLEDEEGATEKRKNKRVNAFMDGDEDAIDYSDDDPEDEDLIPENSDSDYDEEDPDDEKSEVESYDSEINEIITDDDIEEDVVINEEDDDEEDDEDEEDYSDEK